MTGMHELPNNGASNDWITPPEIVSALGKFDLDPCFSINQFYQTAKKTISLPEDGLTAEWTGRVWLNPPYGSQLKFWLKKLSEHGNGIALVPSRTEVLSWFWPYIWESADAVFFFKGRLSFLKPYGRRLGNAGHGSVLVAYGKDNVEAIKQCGIEGYLCEL